MPDIRRRLPGIEKKISSIQPESDIRVRLTGTVIDIGTNSLVLDDGTGKVEIVLEEQPRVNVGQMARVIARILPLIDGFQCRGEVVQSLDDFDMNLYKKVNDIVKR